MAVVCVCDGESDRSLCINDGLEVWDSTLTFACGVAWWCWQILDFAVQTRTDFPALWAPLRLYETMTSLLLTVVKTRHSGGYEPEWRLVIRGLQ